MSLCKNSYRPRLEQLEDRTLLDAYISSYGNLVVRGSAGSDRIYISEGYGTITVKINGQYQDFATSQMAYNGQIYVFGNDGNDDIDVSTDRRVWEYGGFGNDTLQGDKGNDVLRGGPGSDVLSGWDGNDWLEGEGDNDSIYGGWGTDMLSGGPGNDMLHDSGDGTTGYMYGGYGRDTYYKDSYDRRYDPDQ